MQITYCDACGSKLTADNKAGRQQSYITTITQEHPILPSKDIDVEVNLTFGSNVGMSRVTNNNGDFCQTCLEGVVITAMLARQAEAIDEALDEEDEEAETEEETDEEETEDTEGVELEDDESDGLEPEGTAP